MTWSPWGEIQHTEKFLSGVTFVSTPGHGGIRLSPKRVRELPECLRDFGIKTNDGYLWWEKHCHAPLVAFVWESTLAEKLGEDWIRTSKAIVRDYIPDLYEKLSGEKPTVENSEALRRRAFDAAHVNDFVAVAAWGSWHEHVPEGFVGIVATRGRFRATGAESKKFLVEASRYDARSKYGYVVDPSIDRAWVIDAEAKAAPTPVV